MNLLIQNMTKMPSPAAFRVRLTFGSMRGVGATGQHPLVLCLPRYGKPTNEDGHAIYLNRHEKVSAAALGAIRTAVEAGHSAVVACTDLADAIAAFEAVAEAAGYAVGGAARVPA